MKKAATWLYKYWIPHSEFVMSGRREESQNLGTKQTYKTNLLIVYNEFSMLFNNNDNY